MGIRLFCGRVHRLLGLSLAPLLAVVGLTGAAAVFQPELEPWPAAAGGASLTAAAVAEAARAAAPAGLALAALELPAAGQPAVAWLRGEDGRPHLMAVDPADGRVLGQRPADSGLGLVRRLHITLLQGDGGRAVVGAAGLGLLLLLATGLVRWWPARRAPVRRRLLDLHRAGGAVAAAVLATSALTGAAMAFPSATAAVLGLDGPVVPRAVPSPASPDTEGAGIGGVDIDTALAAAAAAVPGARPTRVQLPDGPHGSYRVTLRQPGEVRRKGFTFVWIDRNGGAVLKIVDPARLEAAPTAWMWLKPLHSGEALGVGGRLAAALSGLTAAFLATSAPLLWLARRRKAARAVHRSPI